MLITFEGIEGSGKTTQVGRISEWCRTELNLNTLLFREPGGTPLGDEVRKILLRPDYAMKAETELFLFLASRTELCRTILVPALKEGFLVLVDRFGDSSVAYQGYGRGLSPAWVRELVEVATGNLRPDLTVLFDIDPRIGLERSRGIEKSERLGSDRDRMESESLEFFERVREGYLAMAREEPDRFQVIPVTGTAEETFEQVKRIMTPFIPGKGI